MMFPKICERYSCPRKKHSVDQMFYKTNISAPFKILLKSSPISSFSLLDQGAPSRRVTIF